MRRRRAVLWNLLDYAVELGELPVNPITTIKWSAPSYTGKIVDPATVVNPEQASALLATVGSRPGSGPRLMAFYACMYYAGLRPAEAAELRRENLHLPAEGRGKIYIDDSTPHVGKEWTDDGEDRDHRQLKHREVGEGRWVPRPQRLTAILYKHLATFGTDAEGRLFSSQRGGPMPAITYRLVWKAARETVFGVEAAKTPLLAKRPYDLRHAAVSTWLSGGVEPKRIADWAGHSPEILMKVYAKVLDGGEDAALDKIDVVLGT